jgi:hypothetical protein
MGRFKGGRGRIAHSGSTITRFQVHGAQLEIKQMTTGIVSAPALLFPHRIRFLPAMPTEATRQEGGEAYDLIRPEVSAGWTSVPRPFKNSQEVEKEGEEDESIAIDHNCGSLARGRLICTSRRYDADSDI